MFDGFEFNPTFEITAIEFTFKKLAPLQAVQLAQALVDHIDYAGFSDVDWGLVTFEGKPTLRGQHPDVPIAVSHHNLNEFVDRIGLQTRHMVAAYNEAFGADVKFHSVSAFYDPHEVDEWEA